MSLRVYSLTTGVIKHGVVRLTDTNLGARLCENNIICHYQIPVVRRKSS